MTELVSSITGTKNILLNVLILGVLAFIAVLLIAVSIEAFSDLDRLNTAF